MQEMEEEGGEREIKREGGGGVDTCTRSMAGSNWRISDNQFQITFHLKGNPAYELQHLTVTLSKKASINQFCCSGILSSTLGGE